jgi:hypothetical protein
MNVHRLAASLQYRVNIGEIKDTARTLKIRFIAEHECIPSRLRNPVRQ